MDQNQMRSHYKQFLNSVTQISNQKRQNNNQQSNYYLTHPTRFPSLNEFGCSPTLSFLSYLLNIIMRTAGIYLVEAEIGTARIAGLPQSDILLTLRIGRNYATANHPASPPPLNFNTTLQLNVDSSALDTQRCSLSLNLNTPNDKRILGIALISLPKDKNTLSSTYRLTQSEDKKAEIDLKIKITSIDSASSLKGTLQLNSEATAKFDEPKQETDTVKEGQSNQASNIKLKSKTSEDRSGGSSELKKQLPKSYKLVSQGKMIEISEADLKRYKDQKDAYYQMYQIEKAKNQIAAQFISSVIKKLSEKYPSLVPNLHEVTEMKRSTSDGGVKGKQADLVGHLEQANRSLHRQIEQYKKIVDQLKQQVASSYPKPTEEALANRKTQLLLPSILDLGIVPRQSSRQKSNIIPAHLKESQHATAEIAKPQKDMFAGVDLKKWLQVSIGQREQLQSKLLSSTITANDKSEVKTNFMKKLKLGIDKAFAKLLNEKDLTRQALLTHKQEVNRVIQEYSN